MRCDGAMVRAMQWSDAMGRCYSDPTVRMRMPKTRLGQPFEYFRSIAPKLWLLFHVIVGEQKNTDLIRRIYTYTADKLNMVHLNKQLFATSCKHEYIRYIFHCSKAEYVVDSEAIGFDAHFNCYVYYENEMAQLS